MVPAVRGLQIVKLESVEKASFMMVPAVRGPQIVKLESVEKASFMMVPAVRGHEIVKFGCPQKSNFMMVPAVRGPQIVKLESWKTKKKSKFIFFNFRDSNFMISRPDARNSIIKLDLCAPFCTRFLMLPALRAPQIVKLELGGQKIAF